MKQKIFRIITLFTASLFAFACSSGGGQIVDPEEPGTGGTTDQVGSLTVPVESIKTSVLGEIQTFVVESSGNWKATVADKDWISIFPSSGTKGETEVEITIDANNSNRDRSSEIVFTLGSHSATVNIFQEWSHIMTLPCSSYSMSYVGGKVFIDGISESGTSITIPDDASEWITTDGNRLDVTFNESESTRSATITINDSATSQTHNVKLSQKGVPDSDNILILSELRINGYNCPTDNLTKANDFMYSVDMDATSVEPVKIEFYGEGVQWITVGNDNTKIYSGDVVTLDKLKAKSSLRIYSHCATTSKKGVNSLIVSGLPIVEVLSLGEIKDEPKVDCTIRLFDPKGRTDDGDRKNLKFFESKGGIEYRGAGAQRYIKKPYNFKLYDNNGEKREAELLNIRNDNSWILDAMFLDVAHMRTRVCFDIWNQFNKPYYVSEKPKAMSGTRGLHVEVFLNGAYRGLFTLTDRIDRKQYQIEQNGGYIYKAKGWTDACKLRGYSARSSNDDYYWNSADIEQEYPDADDGYAPNFNHMADLIDFVAKSSKEDFSAHFEEHLDMNSIVDGFIFLNMIVAHDNIGRNTFWILRDVNESKKFMHGLWDLDGTLGRTWNRFNESPTQGWVYSGFRIYERIIDENPANIHQKIYDRWNELKNGALASENFDQIVDSYAKLMIDSGARDREVNRWMSLDMADRSRWGYADVYYNDVEGEIVYMKDWWAKRLVKMDQLVNTLKHK